MNKYDEEMNLKTITKYITENYNDSCFANNIRSDDDEYLLNELQGFFIYELLGICGCGDPELAIDTVIDYLSILNETSNGMGKDIETRESLFKEKFGYENIYGSGLFIFLAYILDDKQLTEHGSSIGWCWITDLGKMCLYVLTYDKNNQ